MSDHDAWNEVDEPSPVVPPRAVAALLVAVVAGATAFFPVVRVTTVVLGVVAAGLGVMAARTPRTNASVRRIAVISVAVGVLSLVIGVIWIALAVVTSSAFSGF